MAVSLDSDPAFAKGWKQGMRDLSAMHRLAADRGVPLAVVVFPTRKQVRDDGLREPQRRLTDHLAELGVPMIDLTPTFVSMTEADGAFLRDSYLDDVHFSVEGHRRVAALLRQRLTGLGWVAR